MDKTAALYIRVSTDAQVEEGYSIGAQKKMLEAYCVSKNIENYTFYIDGGYSGSNINRPKMQQLILDIKSNKISHVIVYKLDRLSRSQKDTLTLIEDIFNRYEVNFASLNEAWDTSTPNGRLMIGILSAFAQLERENIRERTRMGMKERVKTGLWMGGGRTPFGYDYDREKGILIPNKDAETVKQIYDLYNNGLSTNRIAKMLGFSCERLVIQILKRKSNAGYIQYNGNEYLGKHQPIINLETYEKTMEYMKQRSNSHIITHNKLLSGLLYCGYCGAKMRYQKWGNAGDKIYCYSLDKSKPHLVKDENCPSEKYWAEDIESAVINDVFAFSFNIEKNIANQSLDTIQILHKQYDNTSKKIQRLYNLYAEDEDEILLQTIKENKLQLKSIEKQIEYEKKINVKTQHQKHIIGKISHLSEIWTEMTQQEKILVMHEIIKKITIAGSNIKIVYNF